MKASVSALMPYPFVPLPHASTGPLQGLSFVVKDLFDIAGYPTSGGNPHVLARSGIKTQTAPAVQTLLDAGAECIGKAQTNEMAFSMSGHNAHFGTPINGAAPDRIPGGSSSGSASAVSNGLCDFALGTDTGGSVRTPSSYCGLYGIRPTHGRVSLALCQALCESMDTCGYFARDADTFARVGRVLLGPDPLASAPTEVVAIQALFELMPEPVQQALDGAVKIVRRSVGKIEPLTPELPDLDQAYWDFRYIQGYEAWQAQGELIESAGLVLGPDVASRFMWSKEVSAEQYRISSENRARFRAQWEAILGNRILVLPTVASIAPLRDASGEEIERERQLAHHLLDIAVLCQWPQVSMPLAELDGAPLGLSLLGPAGSDLALVELARQIGKSVGK